MNLRALIIASFVALTCGSKADVTISILARTGQTATSFGGGAKFSTFTEPRITPEGQTLFVSDATGTGLNGGNNTGVFLGTTATSLQLVARETRPAPGFGGGVTYRNTLVNAIARPGGRVGFALGVTGPGIDETSDGVLYFGTPTQLRAVAQESDPAPGMGEDYAPNWIFQSVFFAPVNQRILANHAGQIAFKALLGGGATATDNDALLAGSPFSPLRVAREGAIAPNCGGALYAQEAVDSLFIDTLFNGAGNAAYRTALSGAGVTSLNNRALFIGPAGSVDLFARRGSTAPGVGAGLRYQSFLPQGFNDAADFIFTGTIEDAAGASPANPNCAWLSTAGGAPALLLRQGQTLPGAFSPINDFDSVLINHGGAIAVQVNLDAVLGFAGPQGIWAGTPGAFTLIAQSGMQAPGLPAGQVFLDFDIRALQLNALGEVAFRARVGAAGSGGVDSVWATDTNGTLQLVMIEGDTIVLGGISRTVLGISPLAGGLNAGADEDGRTRALSDNDKLAFLITADGPVPNQAVLVADLTDDLGPNTPPVAMDDALNIRTGTRLPVLDNDTDPDGDRLTIVAVTQGAEGRVAFTASYVTFAPFATFDGTDTFTYTISDGRGGMDTATVTVNNPFFVVRGQYQTDVTQGGVIVGTITVSLGSNGSVHGRFVINGKAFTLNGSAGFDRKFTQAFRRTGLPDLVLMLDFTNPGGLATVSGGATGDAPAYVVAPVAAFATRALPDAPAGRYNFRLPGSPGATEPHGTGWLTMTLSSSARLRFSGVLPDATRALFSSRLRVDGTAVVNARLYRNPKGSFSGTITFAMLAGSDATANFRQVKPMQVTPTPLFNAGFDIMISSDGHRFIAKPAGMRTLTFPDPAMPFADFVFTDGDLGAAVMQKVRVAANDRITLEPPLNAAMTLKLSRTSGVFSGAFTPTGGTKRTYRGVILRKTNEGVGLFPDATQTGSVSYKPTP
ncbi:MAG: Ig-like domain-containing protein [Chthoniobacteraceae bacterium]